jgi:hypothetical protein
MVHAAAAGEGDTLLVGGVDEQLVARSRQVPRVSAHVLAAARRPQATDFGGTDVA